MDLNACRYLQTVSMSHSRDLAGACVSVAHIGRIEAPTDPTIIINET